MTNKHFRLTELAVTAPNELLLTFADGKQYPVRLDAIIAKHPTLRRLSDPEVFATAAIGEWSDTVIWADDDELELAADNLRARAVEQSGDCSHELVWNWMAKNGLTLDRAAQELGLSRRMLAYYRSGEKPVPRAVALAMKGWDALCTRQEEAQEASRRRKVSLNKGANGFANAGQVSKKRA